jgi:hypothetical protein
MSEEATAQVKLVELGYFEALYAVVIREALEDAGIALEVIQHRLANPKMVQRAELVLIEVDEARLTDAKAILAQIAEEGEAAAIRESGAPPEDEPPVEERGPKEERRITPQLIVLLFLCFLAVGGVLYVIGAN